MEQFTVRSHHSLSCEYLDGISGFEPETFGPKSRRSTAELYPIRNSEEVYTATLSSDLFTWVTPWIFIENLLDLSSEISQRFSVSRTYFIYRESCSIGPL